MLSSAAVRYGAWGYGLPLGVGPRPLRSESLGLRTGSGTGICASRIVMFSSW